MHTSVALATALEHELTKHRIVGCSCLACGRYDDATTSYEEIIDHLRHSEKCKAKYELMNADGRRHTLISFRSAVRIPRGYQNELADLDAILVRGSHDDNENKRLCREYLPHIDVDASNTEILPDVAERYSLKLDQYRE